MKIVMFLVVFAVSIAIGTELSAQDHPFQRLQAVAGFRQPSFLVNESGKKEESIRGFERFDERSGVVFTEMALFLTDNGGESWTLIGPELRGQQHIASVDFKDRRNGAVLLHDPTRDDLLIVRTFDGGSNWSTIKVDLTFPGGDLDLANARLAVREKKLEIFARIVTSSNFEGRARFVSGDGLTWNLAWHLVEPHRDKGPPVDESKGNWSIEAAGECFGFKKGCIQVRRLIVSGVDVTPPPIRESIDRSRAAARREAESNPMFGSVPGGSTRISLNRGFDKCTAAPVSQMQAWWDNSHFHDANIYMSGRNRGCTQAQLTPSWVQQISEMGWGLIPTIVGYQSPCSVCTSCAKHSYDPSTAEQQGRGEADIAVNDANNLGLTSGSILYYDMERYDETAGTPGCRVATTAFLKGWTERVRELGYKSGTYGSPRNAIDDWQFMPEQSRMEAVWMARWDNVPSVWTYVLFPTFPNNVWHNHQRIKQWQGPHNETWGGVTFEIDGNIADGPVAGVPIPRNVVSDFDGDGLTDISVFRPPTGQWFVAGTAGPSYNIYQFGVEGDILVPGDYDGDGKTDLAVFRPSNSTWYFRTKGRFFTRQYGQPGDIPAPADYDGDGRTDIALFRPSTGIWYIAFNDSRNTFAQRQFGQDGDLPAAGDYDGDGRDDIAVFRPSNGTWYVQGSAGNFFAATWGESGDIPAPADYDGDAHIDLAVFRPSNGRWYLMRSSEGFYIQQFGINGDVPAPGDYDGDGRYDIAVFRPSNSTWYMSQSQVGFRIRTFGVSTDEPIPTAYLPR
ncbi:MAG TPA: DUF1906 domain-containing protein [Pyrinomonadaceae bacterium]|nr:DUF1906 domain-containing protein [Pyrinomonadaceae bacterium]